MRKTFFIPLTIAAMTACNGPTNPPHGEEGHQCTDKCMKVMEQKSGTEKSQTMEMKEHVCTDACKEGKHVYAHGEKGHQCNDKCMKMMEQKSGTEKSQAMEMKEHVCTDACKEGKHVYAHGEKGHQCTEECIKMHQ